MVEELPGTRSRGGDGSDIDDDDASMVPLLDEDDKGVQGDVAKLVARRTTLGCFGWPAIARRSGCGRRTTSAEDVRDDLRMIKMPHHVTMTCKEAIRREGKKRGLGVDGARRKWCFSPAAVAEKLARGAAAWGRGARAREGEKCGRGGS